MSDFTKTTHRVNKYTISKALFFSMTFTYKSLTQLKLQRKQSAIHALFSTCLPAVSSSIPAWVSAAHLGHVRCPSTAPCRAVRAYSSAGLAAGGAGSCSTGPGSTGPGSTGPPGAGRPCPAPAHPAPAEPALPLAKASG